MRRIEEALEFHNDEAGAPRTCRWCAGRKIGLDFFTAGAPFACSVGFHYCETCNAVLFVYPPLALMGEVSEHAWAQRVPVSQ
ncbi:hypothetical protein EPO34_00555 [Patescibacteria group bacterium]|nr:MAG: hypothetical protein EPO34_00555 [Patescibacteria group bacterium]